ncbi:RidA family protein [Nonomuraea sp. KC401]|uniref:RidA family protein n=1 Tax=Nonomuraea longispora TaxID=1848320 RepID=A0A4V2XIW7_9ACTN|nr:MULTISPECIES: Rid family hydrolase [Nonomuraea]NBE98168.1 RidA family protein [Nonomuraea sp. K271]TDC00376.1 RidA family protein [Nonomuraea longispora]TLF61717.1 RidA family protein [Nonomuraea sp. KC401]
MSVSSIGMENTGRRVFSGGVWEERYGYARAVVAGDRVIVSGCTATVEGEVRHLGDAYEQALTAIDIALTAVATGGLTRDDVVMVRYYVVEQRHFDPVGRAIRDVFRDVRPACTGVRVAGLVDPRMLVEIEIEALRA